MRRGREWYVGLPDINDELNAVAETSVSFPEDVCNRVKKNLTSFEN